MTPWLAGCCVLFGAPPFETALPGDCAAAVLARDVPGLLRRAQTTAFARAFLESAGPARDDFRKRYAEFAERLRGDHGVDLAAFADVFRGQAAAAVALHPAGEHFYLLLEVGAAESGFRAAAEAVVQKLLEKGAARRTQEGDVTVLTFRRANADAEPTRFCWALAGGVVAAADEPGQALRLLRGLRGALPAALAENEKFRRLRAGFGANAPGPRDAEVFVLDAPALAARAKAAEPAPDENPRRRAPAGLGLPTPVNAEQLGSFGWAAGFAGDGGIVAQLAALAPKAVLREGFAVTPRRALAPQPWLPANTRRYLSFPLDADALYDALRKLAETLGPGVFDQIETRLREFPSAGNPLVTGIKRDLLEPLGGRVTLLGDDGQYQGAEVGRWMLAVELREPLKYAGLLEGLYGQFGLLAQVGRKQVRGSDVYSLPPQPRRVAPPPGRRGGPLPSALPFEMGALAAAVSGKQLSLATHVELLDRALNADGEGALTENPAAARALARLPPEANMIAYFRADDVGRWTWDYAKSGGWLPPLANQLRGAGAPGRAAADYVQRFRADLLPKFDDVKGKFRGGCAAFLFVEDDLLRGAAFLAP